MTLNLKLSQASERAATAMRDKCVGKVKAIRDTWMGHANVYEDLDCVNAASEIIFALESLTLDQAEQKK